MVFVELKRFYRTDYKSETSFGGIANPAKQIPPGKTHPDQLVWIYLLVRICNPHPMSSGFAILIIEMYKNQYAKITSIKPLPPA